VLGRPGHGWEANIKRNVQEVGCEDVKYTHRLKMVSIGGGLVNMVMNHQVLKWWEISLITVGVSILVLKI
jgi:hypothetical protein